jgi:hypothetical protein
VASERAAKARKKFRTLTGAFESGHFIFIDEMGSNLGLTRRYGRAAPGARVHDAVPGDRGGNISTIGAIGMDGMRTGLSVPGALDGETRLFFVAELLVPTLNRGDIVLMDKYLSKNKGDTVNICPLSCGDVNGQGEAAAAEIVRAVPSVE